MGLQALRNKPKKRPAELLTLFKFDELRRSCSAKGKLGRTKVNTWCSDLAAAVAVLTRSY